MNKITYTEKRFFEWHEDDVSVSIRACSGSYGGGSEVFIVVNESTPSVGMIGKAPTTNMLGQES